VEYLSSLLLMEYIGSAERYMVYYRGVMWQEVMSWSLVQSFPSTCRHIGGDI
jgi:hypothetical protein